MDGIGVVLFFGFMARFTLLRQVIADSLYCGIQRIDFMIDSIPPMRLHSPPGSGCERSFSIF